MITIDLQSQLNSLARKDHLERMNLLLIALDLDQGFSQETGFAESLVDAVNMLQAQGITEAYPQACVLLSMFAGQVSTKDMSENLDPQIKVLHCMQRALNAGIPTAAFQYLFDSMVGIGQFDQPWPSSKKQANLLDLLTALHMNNQPIRIRCDQTGPVAGGELVVSAEWVNLFRTESGFVHQMFGQFTPDYLIAQVCRNALPENALTIHVDPVFERCEIGRQDESGFLRFQRIELIDNRLAQLEFKQSQLSCTVEETQDLRSTWQESGLLIDPVVELSSPWLNLDLSLRAQWVIDQGSPLFVMTAHKQIHAAAEALKWQASLLNNNVPVGLSIKAEQDILIDWQHKEGKLPGQFALGTPLLLAHHKVPLHIQLNSVAGVGGPIVRAASPLAGELVFSLSVVASPVDQTLKVVLTVEHSALVCHWQSVDPVKGWASGCWELTPPARILQRGLSHG